MRILARQGPYNPEFVLKGYCLKMVDFHRSIRQLDPSVGFGIKFLYRTSSPTTYCVQLASRGYKRTFMSSGGLACGRYSSPKVLCFSLKGAQKKKN
jgi:hypothetical protein